MRRNPACDLAREIRRRRDRAIARLGLRAADPGLVLFAILEGFVDAELCSVKIFNPKDEDLCRPETARGENVQHQMLPRLRLREQRADFVQAQKSFADILLNRGNFELARWVFDDEILVERVFEARLNVRPRSCHCGLTIAIGGQFIDEQLQACVRNFAERLIAEDGEHVFAEEVIQILFGFLGPKARLHSAERGPKIPTGRDRRKRGVMFSKEARVLFDIVGEFLLCLVLRHQCRSQSLLL